MFSHTRLRLLVLGVVLCTRVCEAQQGGPETALQACADAAWHASWSRFYKPETHLFYDYLTSYERGKELAHQIINTGSTELRYLAVSTMVYPEAVEYPDSAKVAFNRGKRLSEAVQALTAKAR